MPTLYNLRLLDPDKYAIAKFSEDFNVEAVYELTRQGAGFRCSCPAGLRTVKLKPCKHQRMLPYMLGAVNTDRFFDPERGQWHQPMTADLHEITRESEAAVETSVNGGAVTGRFENTNFVEETPQPAAPPPATQAPPTVQRPNSPPPSAAPIVTRRI